MEKVFYTISEEESKRISIMKLWLIVFVVFLHSYSVFTNEPMWLHLTKSGITEIVTKMGVPGFFFLSALLLYKKEFKWKENIKKKLKTLGLPYLIMNTFWIVVYAILQNTSATSIYFANEKNTIAKWNALDFLNAYIGFREMKPFVIPLWFVRDLLFLNLIAVLIGIIIKKFPKISFVVLILIWIFVGKSPVFCLDVQAICFWGFGCLVAQNNLKLEKLDKYNPLWFIVPYAIFAALDIYTKEFVSFNFGNGALGHYFAILPNQVIHRVGIVFGLLMVYRCFTKVKEGRLSKFLLYISGFTFSIYLFHEWTLSMVKKFTAHILPQTDMVMLLEYLLIPIGIIVGCLLFSMLFKKLLPKAYSVVTGNR